MNKKEEKERGIRRTGGKRLRGGRDTSVPRSSRNMKIQKRKIKEREKKKEINLWIEGKESNKKNKRKKMKCILYCLLLEPTDIVAVIRSPFYQETRGLVIIHFSFI